LEHPGIGAELVEELRFLKSEIPTIRHHHEWFDGTGYPEGLKGEKIPLGARILAIADAYNSIIAERPYRKGTSASKALKELQKQAGTQFDPRLVRFFAQRQNELISGRSSS
jgi:HD-GYP domain-containing protein (c-di-GMP phosphodiesterase class II)